MAASELAQLNDPNQAVAIAVGPAFPDLKGQVPGSGLILGNQVKDKPHRFIFKKAHMSREDCRIFDAATGHPAAVMHHYGKNPYAMLDPLELGNRVQGYNNHMGEWESLCEVTGWSGMPSLKIRPKALSRHGRQYVYLAWERQNPLFNVGKESKLKNLSLRSNLAVRRGDGKEVVYRILPDLVGRTVQVVTSGGDLVCFVQKSGKALILDATLGSGTEMMIDVAPGVDWTAMLAIVLSLRQVGAHFVKDAVGNYVLDPLKDKAVAGAVSAVGAQQLAAAAGNYLDSGHDWARKLQELHRMFTA